MNLIISFISPFIVIGITQILKKWISSRWAPLIVFLLGGISTLIGIGPAPGAEFIDKIVNVAFVAGGATLIYDLFKKLKGQSSKLNAIILILAFSFQLSALTSCATFESNTYKSLYSAGTAYNLALKTVVRLDDFGKLSPGQKATIIDLATLYYVAYEMATDAFEIYIKVKTEDNKINLDKAIIEVFKKLGDLKNYVDEIQKVFGGKSAWKQQPLFNYSRSSVLLSFRREYLPSPN